MAVPIRQTHPDPVNDTRTGNQDLHTPPLRILMGTTSRILSGAWMQVRIGAGKAPIRIFVQE